MPPKQDWINPKIKIIDTENRGKGMFASELISKGETVIIWGGHFVNKEQADRAKSQGKLIMQFDEDLFSIEERGASEAYYINHSCEPNAWMKDTFTLEAMQDIFPQEELTADYALWEADAHKISKWECLCKSPICRHQITGKDWQLPQLQIKYNGHFLPLIQKMITRVTK